MSLALEICRITHDTVGAAVLPRVREVGVVVGLDSGVEPENLEFCLEALLGNPPFKEARPALELTPGEDLRVSYVEVDDDDSPD